MPASTSVPDPDLPLPTDPPSSLAALAARAIDDGKAVVGAEVALFRAKIDERVGAYRRAAVLFVVAGVLVLAALVALLVGLILTLATLIGPGFATAVVIGTVLVVAIVLALVGKSRLARPALDGVA